MSSFRKHTAAIISSFEILGIHHKLKKSFIAFFLLNTYASLSQLKYENHFPKPNTVQNNVILSSVLINQLELLA